MKKHKETKMEEKVSLETLQTMMKKMMTIQALILKEEEQQGNNKICNQPLT